MKRISNTIRIGMVARETISQKSIEKYPNLNDQAQINPSPPKQQLAAQNTYATYGNDPINDQQRITQFTSPTNVRLHDVSDINSNKQQLNNNGLNHHQSLASTRPRQETVSELYEVPSKIQKVTTKKVLVGVGAAVVIGSIIVVGVVLGVVLTRSNNSATTSSTTPTTTIAPTIISAMWSFDSITNDQYGIYNGSLMNSPIYSNGTPPMIPYFGSGQTLVLNGANQFVSVTSPFLPLNSTSFTIEAWIYSLNISSDRGIFGQCQCSTCANQCLYFICRGGRLFVDFTMNDLWGSTTLAIGFWYHVAFVYNSQTQQQILYVNGVQDAIKSNAAPYQGTNGSIQIGATQVFGTTNFFAGFIDNVWITTRAKPADEILRDASLIVYYSFDLSNPNADSGPNKILGNSTSTITVTGRVNQAIRFVGASSYFQMYGLNQVPSGVPTNRPFSVSLWFNPSSATTCTFFQFYYSSARCANFLGIVSAGGSTIQIFVHSTGSQTMLTGPFVTQNVWSHISVTYNSVNGYSLFYNGVYFGSTGAVVYSSSGTLTSLFVGFYANCGGVNQNTPCQGSIDELYVHNRELTQAEITTLANP